MGINQTTRTVGQLQTALNRQFGDEAAVQVTLTDVIRWINQAQLEIVKDNSILRALGNADIVSGTYKYDLAALNILTIKSIQLNGVPLQYVAFDDFQSYIIANDPKRVNTGDPTRWTEWAGNVYVYPTPNISYTAGLQIYYQMSPADVTGTSSLLSVPDIYFNTVLAFCLQQAYELDENWAAVQVKATQFQTSMSSLSERGANASTDHYPMPTTSVGDGWGY